MQKSTAIILGILIAIGLTLAGTAIGVGYYSARTADRYVTVKGLAEREVDADLAIWPITFVVTGNNLNTLQQQIDEQRQIVSRFLVDSGFSSDEISYSAPRIRDLQSEQYNQRSAPYRYQAQSTVTTRSPQVMQVKKTMEESGKLVASGVVLVADNWENPTEFLFTSLNDIKPEMIEEATKNAREAAEKFALDSGSKVGKIRHANQGLFTIRDRDRNSPERKIVRVVTTIDYYLE